MIMMGVVMSGSSFAVFVLVMVVVQNGVCDNATHKYPGYPSGHFETRKSKLLSFNTGNDDQINVELDFSVPFLSIPVKPTADAAHGAMANLNIGAVVLAGMMAFGAALVIPTTYALFGNKLGQKNPLDTQFGSQESEKNRYRHEGEVTSSLWTTMAAVDKALSDNNIDSTSCVQRALCWTVKTSNSKLSNGEATSADKIIDGLATNSYIQHLVDGSVFQAAIDSGLSGANCIKEYSQCKINQNSIQTFGKQLISAIYNRK